MNPNLIPLGAAGLAILAILLLGLYCVSVKVIDTTIRMAKWTRNTLLGA